MDTTEFFRTTKHILTPNGMVSMINEISNKDLKMNDFFSKNLLYLNQAKDLLDNNIQTKFKFGLKIIHQLSNSQFIQ